MDGFTVKFSDAGKTLSINKVIFAGDKGAKVEPSLKENECYKIMTGAKVPFDADTIIPIENCFDVTQKYAARIPLKSKSKNLRLKGEEQKEGDVILKKGEKITSSFITLLASQGLVMVEVYKKISLCNFINWKWDKRALGTSWWWRNL